MKSLVVSLAGLLFVAMGCGERASESAEPNLAPSDGDPEAGDPAPTELAATEPAADSDDPAGQSGSEVVGGSADAAMYQDCPCVRLAGTTPFRATVSSWQSTLLELEAVAVLIDDPPEGAPEPGERIVGIYTGQLPCYTGQYLPKPGDQVVAFLLPDESAPNLCCGVAACNEECRTEDGGDVSDDCLAACQGPRGEECAAERARLDVAGSITVAPLTGETLLLAGEEENAFEVSASDLAAIFAGGEQCEAQVGGATDVVNTIGGSLPWQESCSEP